MKFSLRSVRQTVARGNSLTPYLGALGALGVLGG